MPGKSGQVRAGIGADRRRQPVGKAGSAGHIACWPSSLTTTVKDDDRKAIFLAGLDRRQIGRYM
jgi:hypothetical protein